MLLEIPCPKCQSKLRSPTDIRGKTVRCKKCTEKFRVPLADEPVVEPGLSSGDTQQLSVIDTDFLAEVKPKPASAPIAVAKILRVEPEPLELEDIVVAKTVPQPLPLPLPLPPVPPPAPAISAFDFDEQEKLKKKKKKRDDDDDDDEEDRPRKKKRDDDDDDEDDRPRKKKRRDEDDEDDDDGPVVRPKYAGKKGSALPMIMMIGVGGGALLLALIAGILLLTGVIGGKKEVASATTAPTVKTLASSTKLTTNTGAPTSRVTPMPTEPTTPATGVTPTTRRPPPTGPSKQPTPMGLAKLPTMPPAMPELTAKPKFVTTIDLPAEKIQAVRWGNKGTYNVIFAAFRDSEGFRGVGVSDTIEAYNADTGEKMGTMKVKADKCKWPRAFEASPNGKFVAVEGTAGKLTVYDFEDGKFILEDTDVNVGMANRGNAIVGLSWLDDDKLVVVDSHGSTDSWSMATKQPVLRMNNLPGYEDKKVRAITRLGSTGKMFLIARDSELIYLKDLAGTQIPYTGTPMFVAADSTGQQAAVIGKDGEGKPHELVIYKDLSNPRGQNVRVTLPAEVGEVTGMAWQSINSIVVTLDGGKSSLVVDIDPEVGQPTLAFYIKAPDGKARIFDQGPFQYLYYAVSDGKGSKFTAINLDFDDYFKLRNSAKDAKPPSPIYLVPSDKGLSK